jgi:two-component system, sensor histidine kinase LadS
MSALLTKLPCFARLCLHCGLLILVGLAVFPAMAVSDAFVRLTPETVQQTVTPLYRYYDPENHLELEAIREQAQNGKFSRIEKNDGLGYVSGTIWLHFRLQRATDAPSEWWLEVRRPSLDEVDLFVPSPEGWDVLQQGDNRPWKGRQVHNRNSVFVLTVPPGVTDYFLRIRTSSSSASPLIVWQPAAFSGHATTNIVLVSGFALAAILVILINLLMAVSLRERLYLIYALNLICFAGLMLPVEGLIHFLLAPEYPLRLESMVSIFHPLLMLTMGLLLREIIALPREKPTLDRFFVRTLWGVCALGVLAVPLGFSDSLKPWLWKLVLLEMAVNIGLAGWLALCGNRGAQFYLVAFGVLILGGVLSIIGNLGWRPGPALGNLMPLGGSLLHMVLMQLTVNNRVVAAKQAYDHARDRTLATEKRLNEGLQREVSKRTEALENALAFERRGAEQQALFLRLISHEFRTPLAIIDMAARVMPPLPGFPDEAITRCGIIRQTIGRLTQLLERCVADSRVDSPQTLLCEPVKIADLMAYLKEKATLEAPERKVVFHAPAPEIQLWGDKALLQILFGNLLSNALNYSPPQSPVGVDFLPHSDVVRIIVNDQGFGIPPEEIPFVFDKFMRGIHAKPGTGLGLGLSLAKRITELHKGQISLESLVGEGTRVCVVLPLGDVEKPTGL